MPFAGPGGIDGDCEPSAVTCGVESAHWIVVAEISGVEDVGGDGWRRGEANPNTIMHLCYMEVFWGHQLVP